MPFSILFFHSLLFQNVSFHNLPLRALPAAQRQHHYLSAYTMFRGPAHRLPEWIEYHRMMGVEHFYLYDHLWERYEVICIYMSNKHTFEGEVSSNFTCMIIMGRAPYLRKF